MNIVVTGGTGFIGRALCASLLQHGNRVTVLTRTKASTQWLGPAPTVVEWDGCQTGTWEQSLAEADAVINLADAPIADTR